MGSLVKKGAKKKINLEINKEEKTQIGINILDVEEIVLLAVSSLFLGALISFSLKNLKIVVKEFLVYSVFFFFIFLMFIIAQKIVARSLDCNTKMKLLSFSRYGFRPEDKFEFEFPLWVFLPMLLYFLSGGKLLWTAILNFDANALKTRVRKETVEINEKDLAKIAIAGPIVLLIIGLIFRIANLNSFAYICVFTSLLNFLPIGYGVKIYQGMRITGIFLFILTLAILILMSLKSVFLTIFISFLIATILIIIYYALYEQ